VLTYSFSSIQKIKLNRGRFSAFQGDEPYSVEAKPCALSYSRLPANFSNLALKCFNTPLSSRRLFSDLQSLSALQYQSSFRLATAAANLAEGVTHNLDLFQQYPRSEARDKNCTHGSFDEKTVFVRYIEKVFLFGFVVVACYAVGIKALFLLSAGRDAKTVIFGGIILVVDMLVFIQAVIFIQRPFVKPCYFSDSVAQKHLTRDNLCATVIAVGRQNPMANVLA
jgi:hypothetical protein